MNFVVGLPKISEGHNAIWVIIDHLTKYAHFLSIKVAYSLEKLVELYLSKIVKLHEIPISIICDCDSRFTSNFWKSIQRALATKLNLSTAFHPQTDGQTNPTIQILEDMLHACVMGFKGSWNKKLSSIEFS